MPPSLFSWSGLITLPGIVVLVLGGFLVGFGARYAGGCPPGHAITGPTTLQVPSLLAVVGFFLGGLLSAMVAAWTYGHLKPYLLHRSIADRVLRISHFRSDNLRNTKYKLRHGPGPPFEIQRQRFSIINQSPPCSSDRSTTKNLHSTPT